MGFDSQWLFEIQFSTDDRRIDCQANQLISASWDLKQSHEITDELRHLGLVIVYINLVETSSKQQDDNNKH